MNEPEHNEEAMLEAAAQLPAEQRAAYLKEACGADTEQRQRLEALLALYDRGSNFMEEPAAASSQNILLAILVSEKPGDKIGRYKLLQQIGEGGCGIVYMAEQKEPVRRRVALKIIKLGMDTKNVIARFEAERQALALMDHPNIAKVFDAGATETGRPYFVMELVHGTRITHFCDENTHPTEERLKLFAQVCQAIQHAHQKGVIHRDIKPSNILVTLRDGVPVPKVIDFGIAKATTDQRLTDKTVFTAFAQFIGTPAYMSPEQAEMSDLGIDTRSDIYSLGVLLYELLTGMTPFNLRDLRQAGLDEIRRVIREEEPARPSTRLSTVTSVELAEIAKQRNVDPGKLAGLFRGELDWIVMKALEKDRTRRYATANALASDVQRYLADEPVEARPSSGFYRFQKSVRRHKTAFSAAAIIAVLLVAGVVVSMSEAVRARLAEREQTRLRQQAEATGEALKTQEQLAHQEQQVAIEQASLARRRFYVAQIYLASQAAEAGNLARTLDLLETQRPKQGESDLRTFEWYHLWGLCRANLNRTFPGQNAPVRSVAISPDGMTLAAASDSEEIHLWDIATGREKMVLKPEPSVEVGSIVFTPDGLSLVSGSWDDQVRVWDLATGKVRKSFSGDAWRSQCVAVSPDGKSLAAIWEDGRLQLWNLATGELQANLPVTAVPGTDVAFSPDGTMLATSGSWWVEDKVKLWDITNGSLQLRVTLGSKGHVAFRPDGRIIATADTKAIYLWDTETGKLQVTMKERAAEINSLAWLPDGNTLVSCGADRSVRWWRFGTNLDNRLASQVIAADQDSLMSMAVSPDGSLLATSANDGAIRLWNLPPTSGSADHPIAYRLNFAAGKSKSVLLSMMFAPDGQKLTGITSFGAFTKDVASGQNYSVLPDATGRGALSPDGKLLASGGLDGTLKLWDCATGHLLASVKAHHAEIGVIAFSPDGRLVATGGAQDPNLRVWDTSAGLKPIWTQADFHTGPSCLALAFSPDGKDLAAVMYNQSIYLFDATTGHPKRVLKLNTGGAGTRALVFSPDGRLLATAGERGTVKLWDLEAGRMRGVLQGHTSGIYCLAFSPDGNTIVTGDNDFAVRLWDTVTGQERMTLGGLNDRITAVAFSPDGNTLAAASRDGYAQLWRASLAPEARTFDNRPAEDKSSAMDDVVLANLLDRYSQDLRDAGDFIGAESSVRQCLALREKNIPDDWRTFDAQILLGGCLLDQKKYAEAEPLLLSGYTGLKQCGDAVLADGEPHLQAALARLVQLDEATGRSNQVVGWRSESAGWDRKTLEQLRNAAKQGDPQSLNDLAWFLATAGTAGIRDGTGALAIAEKIMAATGRKKAAYLDTLAAAYAETGQFTNAVSVQNEAIGFESDERVKKGLVRRLKLYETNSPYHEQE